MRRLIMWNMVTLDGFFEGPKSWEIDWHEYVWGDELRRFSIEQSKSIGMLGRRRRNRLRSIRATCLAGERGARRSHD